MKHAKVRIADINPHNIFLAEEPIRWLKAHYKQIQPIDVCVYNGKTLSDDGDHRMYLFHKRNRIYAPANIYDLNDPQDRKVIQEKREKLILEYLAQEIGMDIDWVRKQYPKTDESDLIEEFNQDRAFVRSLGIHSIADLAKREILKTKEDIQSAYWRLRKEFNER